MGVTTANGSSLFRSNSQPSSLFQENSTKYNAFQNETSPCILFPLAGFFILIGLQYYSFINITL